MIVFNKEKKKKKEKKKTYKHPSMDRFLKNKGPSEKERENNREI